MVHYYVSREYKFASWGTEDTYPRKCRFVFVPNENTTSGGGDEIALVAIADKPANLMPFVENRNHYEKLKAVLQKRAGNLYLEIPIE